MSSREHVENTILKRLTREKPGDLQDWEVEAQFTSLYPAFEVAMDKVLRRFTIPQFDDDDLRVFMLMKAHQILKRRKYDESRNPYAFFYTAFSNLMLDILTYQSAAKYESLGHDVLDIRMTYVFDEQRDSRHVTLEIS